MDIDKTKFRKEIIVPFSGQRFLIRRVRLKEFISEVGGLGLAVSPSVQEVIAELTEKAKSGDTAAEEKVVKFYITKGVIEPKVWFGDDAQCPEDQIYYLDMASDLDALATEIINYSNGMAIQSLENFFFQQAGTGNPRLDGAEIQPEAVEPTA